MQTKIIIDHIVKWLSDYADNSGCAGFVVGVSGGIDSALTSTLCALTGKKTVCVNMPIHQKAEQITRSEMHIQTLKSRFSNVADCTVQLTDSFEAVKASLPAAAQSHLLSMANTRSRLRMLTLYAIAQSDNMLVVGTGNKIEDFGVGFFTKYGDGGVDISPIADLTKSQVYKLSEFLSVAEEIIKAAPTDGLWDVEREDEVQLGASYPELEWAMEYLKKEQTGELNERQREVLKIYQKFNKANRHKMIPVPVCKIPDSLF